MRTCRISKLRRKIFYATKLAILCSTIFLLVHCQSTAPDDLVFDGNQASLIFVKTKSAQTLNHAEMGDNNLFCLTPISPNGRIKQLTQLTEGAVADPEISYDGMRIYFSMRKSWRERWHLYRMNLDGTNLRQLTFGDGDDFDPTCLPNRKILFTSNRANFVDEYNRSSAEVMYTVNEDGSNMQRISFNLSDDFDPFVLNNGRVAYTRWEHHGTMNRFPLFVTNPDGCASFVLFGPHQRNFFHARELPDGNLVAVMSTRVNGDAGALAILKLGEGHGDPPLPGDFESLTKDLVPDNALSGPPFPNGAFKYPFPLPDGRLVVSFAPGPIENEDVADYGLYTINRDGSGLALLYNDKSTNEFDAVVAMPRPIPPVVPEVIDNRVTTGEFIDLSSYFRQDRDGQEVPKSGEIKQVMVIEGLPIEPKERDMISLTSFERKRIIGVAPVYADGSFKIRVPVNTPLSVNTLDSLGRAIVVKRTWFYIRPGEPMGRCIGCHSPRGKMPPNPYPTASAMPPTDLNVPVEKREIVAFENAIAPIIKQKCVACHSGATPAGSLDLSLTPTGAEGDDRYPPAYRNLLSSSRNPMLVVAPFSRKSFLADKLLGVGRAQQGPHPIGANALTKDDVRKFINWIDLGAQYR
jgi:hypothetical protein